MTEELIFKGKKITGDTVEIIFHTDFTYWYNEAEFPVIYYKLTKCIRLDTVDFEKIDSFNDGVTIDIKKSVSGELFTTTDVGGRTVTIQCEKVVSERREYDKGDLVDIIKSLQKQVDGYHERQNKIFKQREEIKSYLKKEIETTQMKLTQADWLTEQKKQFLNGHLTTLRKMIELLEIREK